MLLSNHLFIYLFILLYIYYVQYLKCSTNTGHDVSCSQNSLSFFKLFYVLVWMYLAWKTTAFVQQQELKFSVVPFYNFHWLFHCGKTTPPSPSTQKSNQVWLLCVHWPVEVDGNGWISSQISKQCSIKNVETGVQLIEVVCLVW